MILAGRLPALCLHMLRYLLPLHLRRRVRLLPEILSCSVL